MKKTFLVILILLISLYFVNGQKVIKKKSWKNEYGVPIISEKNVEYIKLTIKESDGTKRYEIRELKSDKLVSLESYKKQIPVGKWRTVDGQDIDYDFELVYSKNEYPNIIKFDIYGEKPIGELKGKFEAPVFPRLRNNFRLHVAENLKYPVKALEKGIQGSIVSQFIIDEEGKIVNLSILESAHKILDKEAARAILESPDWTPAKMDGKPVKVYIVIRNSFFFKEIGES